MQAKLKIILDKNVQNTHLDWCAKIATFIVDIPKNQICFDADSQ